MNYIDPIEYSKLLKSFTQRSTKQSLNESIEEKKELSAKQKKIAAAAPPPDKITGADFAALKSKKEEGMHLGQPTAPTTTTVEGKRDYTKLSVDERKQLKELIESVKTIKQEISKLMEKATMSEGGDTTGLVMPEGDDDLGYATHDGSFDGDDSEYGEEEINMAGDEDRAWKEKERAYDTRMIGKDDMDIDMEDDEFDDMEQRDREERYRMAGPGREA